MEQTITACECEVSRLSEHVQQCADIIKQLQGYSSQSTFQLTFKVEKIKITTFEIFENDVDFAMSYFMYWHTHYQRQLKEQRQRLAVLRCGKGLAGSAL